MTWAVCSLWAVRHLGLSDGRAAGSLDHVVERAVCMHGLRSQDSTWRRDLPRQTPQVAPDVVFGQRFRVPVATGRSGNQSRQYVLPGLPTRTAPFRAKARSRQAALGSKTLEWVAQRSPTPCGCSRYRPHQLLSICALEAVTLWRSNLAGFASRLACWHGRRAACGGAASNV